MKSSIDQSFYRVVQRDIDKINAGIREGRKEDVLSKETVQLMESFAKHNAGYWPFAIPKNRVLDASNFKLDRTIPFPQMEEEIEGVDSVSAMRANVADKVNVMALDPNVRRAWDQSL